MPSMNTAKHEVPDKIAQPALKVKCRVCTCNLDNGEEDNLELQLCSSCEDRPEARRLGLGIAPRPARRPHLVHPAPQNGHAPTGRASARDFTPAERALIARVNRHMAAQQLLDLLNERLVCDLGPDAVRYTPQQLADEVAKTTPALPGGGGDWASLRKLLAHARKSGLLARVNEQVINDFAVVFSLNPKQVIHLKDTLLDAQEPSK